MFHSLKNIAIFAFDLYKARDHLSISGFNNAVSRLEDKVSLFKKEYKSSFLNDEIIDLALEEIDGLLQSLKNQT